MEVSEELMGKEDLWMTDGTANGATPIIFHLQTIYKEEMNKNVRLRRWIKITYVSETAKTEFLLSNEQYEVYFRQKK
jgi:hypothetical protein